MSVYEDEYAIEGLQYAEVWMASCGGGRWNSQGGREAYRENVGAELTALLFDDDLFVVPDIDAWPKWLGICFYAIEGIGSCLLSSVVIEIDNTVNL